MKVLFSNPPYIRSKNSSLENDFAVKGFVRPKLAAKNFLLDKFFKGLWLLGVGKGVRYGVRAGSRWPYTLDFPVCNSAPYPFFLGYAAAYLIAHGIEATILDSVVEAEYDYENYLRRVKAENADIVVIETSTPSIDIDLWLARKIADFTEVALCGPHVSIKTDEVRAACPQVKYFLKGEYVLNCLEMAQTRRPGVYEYNLIKDFDEIPFPFRDYNRADKYYDPTMPTPKPQLQIYASRGCPYKCSFCYWPHTMYCGKYSPRSPEKIMMEIDEAVEKYGYRSIFFDDDTFNIGNDRVSRLCDLLKKKGLPWTMMGRLDCSPDWIYDKMVDSGCVGMRFGVETFNIDCLKRISKGIERVKFRETLEQISLKYPKLMIHLTMMRDMPGQTDAIHEQDMKILKDMGYSQNYSNIYRNFQLATCAPFPGTKMYNDLIQKYGEAALSCFSKYDGSSETIMRELDK